MEKRTNCPMCENRGLTPDRSGHLYTNEAKKVFICFRCGWKGRADTEDTPRIPLAFVHRQPPPSTTREEEMKRLDMRVLPTEPETRVQASMLAYLAGRHITAGMVRSLRLHYAATGPYSNRVVFPCFGDNGVEFFVARSIIANHEPKILHPPKDGIWPGKSEVVWGLDNAQTGVPITICEGVFDAAIIPNGVAILGKFLSLRQTNMICLRATRVNIMLDGDALTEAQDMASRIRKMFPRVTTRIIYLQKGEDPSSIGPEKAGSLVYNLA